MTEPVTFGLQDRIEYEWVEYSQLRCSVCGNVWQIWADEVNAQEQRTLAESHVCDVRP